MPYPNRYVFREFKPIEEHKLGDLPEVREYIENAPVELWIREGRVVVRAYNEGCYNCTDIDLIDLLEAFRFYGTTIDTISARIANAATSREARSNSRPSE